MATDLEHARSLPTPMSCRAKRYLACFALVTACEVPFVVRDDAVSGGGAAGNSTAGRPVIGEGGGGSEATPGGAPSAAGSAATADGGDDVSAGGAAGAAGAGGESPLTPCREGIELRALSVSAGEHHACAVQAETGSLYCWGSGSSGQLGNGDTQDSAVPVKVRSNEPFLEVSVGTNATCARSGAGALFCFGNNFDGQLANQTTQGASLPVITLLGGTSSFAHSAGYVLALAGTDLFAWGSNTNGQLGLGDAALGRVVDTETDTQLQGIASVTAGYTHACVIDQATRFGHCAGSNQDSRLGVAGEQRTTFTQLSQHPLAQISAGYDRTCAVTERGLLLCWGHNLPVSIPGEPAVVTAPTQVGTAEDWQRVSVGFDHVCGTTTDLALVCAGDNSEGELGFIGPSSPSFVAPVPALRSSAFSAGRNFTCALREPDSAVVCFGSNEQGKLGRGSSDESAAAPGLVCLPP